MSLKVSELTVKRGGTVILHRISLCTKPGEIIGVFGPSGAGKSTLFQAIIGELPVQGTILLGEHSVAQWPIWQRARIGLGYVPQGTSVLLDLSVRDNLRTFARLSRRPTNPEDWAQRIGLESRLSIPASSLSGGERRRLELARALLAGPSVLLCDEPFAGLNPGAIGSVTALLREAAASGVSVVISDHHLPEALSLTNRALLLLDGRIEAETDAISFPSHPLVQQRYVSRG
ncbi:MAG: ATP-binding cassette domain-containing protein [Myxococcales bacterium]|nr:ATP-binding cassette domain-containing protein [Polyangiaceae bacterium]MDW8251778.1 ATP-binding cassette domain-containing protein [Myxococcales bacterium]